MIQRTPNTITTVEALKIELSLTQRRGYAIDNEENEVSISCVGAPIFDYNAMPIAAISISVPHQRINQESYEILGPLVMEAADMVSRRKGFSGKFPGSLE